MDPDYIHATAAQLGIRSPNRVSILENVIRRLQQAERENVPAEGALAWTHTPPPSNDNFGLPAGYKPHNPDNLTREQVGKGFRLLADVEIWRRSGIRRDYIHRWGSVEWDKTGWWGQTPDFTYRVPIDTPLDPNPELKNPATPPPSNDPKGEAGSKKAPLWLLPHHVKVAAAWVLGLGAKKYGPWNWRKTRVCASTYLSAIQRHLGAWEEREDVDPESGQNHLAHIIANCAILLDAQKYNCLDDDRP